MTGLHFGCKGTPLCTTLPAHGPQEFATAAEQHRHVHPGCHHHEPASITRKRSGQYQVCACGAARVISNQTGAPVTWTYTGAEWVTFP